MVGTEYQADVPSCLCHYKDGEKGDFFFYMFVNVMAYSDSSYTIETKSYIPGD